MRRAHSPVETMVVTPDGTEAPFFIVTFTEQHAREFLRNYDEYITSVDRHVALGDDRQALGPVALVLVAKRHALRSRSFRGQVFTEEVIWKHWNG